MSSTDILRSLSRRLLSSLRDAVAGNSPADQTQQLFEGDALVEVNGTFVAHLDLEKIIMIIATAGKNITLRVSTSGGSRGDGWGADGADCSGDTCCRSVL